MSRDRRPNVVRSVHRVRSKHRRSRWLDCGLAFAVFVIGSASPGLGAQFQRVELSPHEAVLEVALLDLDGDGVIDPVVASARTLGAGRTQRFLTFYRVTPQGIAPATEQKVPDDVVAFGLGDLRGRGKRELVYFTAQSVFVFDAEAQRATRVIADHHFPLTQAAPLALPYWDAILDLDGDGRMDLLLADTNGYTIYHQRPERGLVRAGHVAAGASYASVPLRRRWRQAWASGPLVLRRSIRRMSAADVNGDGRLDLVGMKGDHLLGFEQNADGGFGAHPTVQHRLIAERGVPFARYGAMSPPAVQHGDIDGDGRDDFVVPELDLEELVTRLRVFLAGPRGLPDKPSQILKLSSLGSDPELVDMNDDGKLDLGCATFRTDRISALVAGAERTLDFTYFGFLFRPDSGSFSRRPDLEFGASWQIPDDDDKSESEDSRDSDAVDPALARQESGFIRLAGDFDGDGTKDLVLFTGEGELSVHAARLTGDDPKRPQIASTPLLRADVPAARRVSFADLDADGKTDVVLLGAESVQILWNR